MLRTLLTDILTGTVMHLQGEIYFIYSGWPLEKLDDVSELIQQLYIFRMADPVTAASPPVRICKPEERWEFTADHGINEGPQYLESPDGSWRGIVYSCAGSWTKEYKMNTLRFLDGDPLNPSSWQKGTKPLMKNGPHNDGPWGPGHGSFMHIGNEIVGIYHATDGPGDGWENRKARMQRVVFGQEGPWMGEGVGPLTRDYSVFLGSSSGGHGGEDGHGHHRHGLRKWLHDLRDEL